MNDQKVDLDNIYEVAEKLDEHGNVVAADHLKSCAYEISHLRGRIRHVAEIIERRNSGETEVSKFLRKTLKESDE